MLNGCRKAVQILLLASRRSINEQPQSNVVKQRIDIEGQKMSLLLNTVVTRGCSVGPGLQDQEPKRTGHTVQRHVTHAHDMDVGFACVSSGPRGILHMYRSV
jgi:hypothetical protein